MTTYPTAPFPRKEVTVVRYAHRALAALPWGGPAEAL
jgi:hypothetical protein